MPLAGYPDWQRVQYAGGLGLANVTADASAGLALGEFNVQAWRTLICRFDNLTSLDSYQVIFEWSNSKAIFPVLTETRLGFAHAAAGILAVPVLAPWVRISVQAESGTDHNSVLVDVYTGSELMSTFDLIDQSYVPLKDSSAYGVNSTKTFLMPYVYSGSAVMYVRGISQTYCNATLEYQEFPSPSWLEFFAIQNVGQSGIVSAIAVLPAAPVRMRVFNFATAQTVNVSLMPINGR